MTKKTPRFIEEVRKWRKKLHKETEGMSEEERIRYINEKAKKNVAEHMGKREKREKLAK
ncbi:MAG: hypothetical protein HY776_01645 [Actinobacteria bacterium]|nr:hypothetical protein [Actinomycetota bacterium]